jgi:YidC/Oxa1 family membrane protein insertase
MEQKNFLLAIGLSIAFLFIWSVFVVPRFTPPPLPTPPAQVSAHADVSGKTAELTAAHPEDHAGVTMDSESILRDERNEIVLTARGGAVRHWRLNLKGHELDLVNSDDSDTLPLATFPNQLFRITQSDHQAVMSAILDNGVHLTKTLRLSEKGYLQEISLHFENPGSHPVDLPSWEWGWGPGLGTAETEKKDNPRLIRAISLGKIKTHVLKPGEYPDTGLWSGIDNRYFLIAFIPPAESHPQFIVTGTKLDTRVALRETTSLPAHGGLALNYQLYAGPKGYTQLSKYGKGLENAVDFGTFSPIGKLILSAIYRLYGWTGNYGWSIVILTICLQTLMLPLTFKSFKAQLAMKQLQPKIAAIQAQYKSDPKRLNVEMMNIYKKTGTNPFGGCLPMLLQLPIFWALFTTLRNAYELRGTPFVGWIHDLSAPDPLHVLPVVMGVAMFFQQRMSGAATDPTQKQMMTVMPIMFTVMFFNFPAGLVLYWLTNNLLTMTFQYGFQRNQRRVSTPSVVNTTLIR